MFNREDSMRHKVCGAFIEVVVLADILLTQQVMKASGNLGAFITGNLSVFDSGATVKILEVVQRQG